MSNTGNLNPMEDPIRKYNFTIDPMEFFFNTGHVTNIHIHYIT